MKHIRRVVMWTVVLSGMIPVLFASDSPRPNLVFILTDDQGYGDLACHGHPVIETPHLDQLHAQSVRLTDFHVAPCCSLSRAQLLTGRYTTRTGVWHTVAGRSLLHRDEQTLAHVFSANGYRTGIFGKWHLGDNYPSRAQDHGFDEVLIHGGGGVGNLPDYWANDYYDDTYFRNGVPQQYSGYCTDVWFREATKFIEQNAKRQQPFFCYIPTNAPHLPFVAPKQYVEPYLAKGLDTKHANFYGMIANIDENVGRLRLRLVELGIQRDTLVVFSTDNGSVIGNQIFKAQMRGGKGSEYDGGHRVPLFVHWPGGRLTGGRDVDRLAAGIDLLPTLAELCGLERPAGPPLDGISLVPLLRGQADAWPERTPVVDNQRVTVPVKWRRSSVMTDHWRLVNGTELHDIEKDPTQSHNVADRHPEVVAQLRASFDRWWESLQPAMDRDCLITIGSDRENPTMLTAHDLFGACVWNHDQVLAGKRCDGYWGVDVAQDGVYEFGLRRWPREVDGPITSAIPIPDDLKDLIYYGRDLDYAITHDTSAALPATYARLRIGEFDENKTIPEGAEEVTFRVPLTSGPERLQAWFVNGADDGDTHGVYYVYARRIER